MLVNGLDVGIWKCFFIGAVGESHEVLLSLLEVIVESIFPLQKPSLVRICDTRSGSSSTELHAEQWVKARLTKELMTQRRYFSGHSLAALRQKPRFVDFTYTSVVKLVVLLGRRGTGVAGRLPFRG